MKHTYTVKAAMLLRALDIALPVDLMAALDEQGYDLDALDRDAAEACLTEAAILDEAWVDLENEMHEIAELTEAFRLRALELA